MLRKKIKFYLMKMMNGMKIWTLNIEDKNNLIKKLNELTFLVKNMTYKFFKYSSYIRDRLDKCKVRYPSSIGHYLMMVNSEQSKDRNNSYSEIYLQIKNKIINLNS